MHTELLTSEEMGRADRLTIAAGPLDGVGLMRRAGAAVAAPVLDRYPGASPVHVLCGPGNNGGDGYVVARLLAEAGVAVTVWRNSVPRPGSDAAVVALEYEGPVRNLADFAPSAGCLVVDALYGAGLSKPVTGVEAEAIRRVDLTGVPVVAIDLPSGVSGDTGAVLGTAFRAQLTVTFFRRKPGHLLLPGRLHCGESIVADIGIEPDVLETIQPRCFANGPDLWSTLFPRPAIDTHKYARGHVCVFSGGPASSGAARLSALAAARAGAGAVTLLSPGNALQVNAAHLTSIMLRKTDGLQEVLAFLAERKPAALVLGPGLGVESAMGAAALDLIGAAQGVGHIVFDADALSLFARQPEAFFAAARGEGAPELMLTPHTGEFARLFPDLATDDTLSKLERARRAAARAAAVVILKGPDTVIAASDGRAAINTNGTPHLATAGSGDVLAGIAAGLLAQGMPRFEAACAAVWLHAEAGKRFGPGLIAEDLPLALAPVLRDLLGG